MYCVIGTCGKNTSSICKSRPRSRGEGESEEVDGTPRRRSFPEIFCLGGFHLSLQIRKFSGKSDGRRRRGGRVTRQSEGR